jgi:hypothetical protein
MISCASIQIHEENSMSNIDSTTDVLATLRLHFNIQHPDLEECYGFGYECASTGVAETENPFAANTEAHAQWSDGWWAGFYGEEPLFELAETADHNSQSSNDENFHDTFNRWVFRALEMTGVIAVSAMVGYQLLEMVA